MLSFIIYKAILIISVFLISLLVAMYSTYAERKVAAFLQDRIGPDRAGPWGIFQPLADGVKMFMKEEIIPNVSNKWLFILGPSIAMLTACMTGAVIPWGTGITIGETYYPLQVTDVNIGILYLFGVVSIGVYGIMIGGWASNNKFALLGAIRASSQMISYELAMGLSIIALVMMTGTLSTAEIAQQQHGWHWNVLYQPLGCLIFIICAFAETNRAPFDMAEAESELVAGAYTEYAGMGFGVFFMAEYANILLGCALGTVLFLGGWQSPIGIWSGLFWFLAKMYFLIFSVVWIRWTFPRTQFYGLLNLSWKILIPISLATLLLTSVMLKIL